MGWNLLILLSVINLIAIIDKTERVFVQLPRKPDLLFFPVISTVFANLCSAILHRMKINKNVLLFLAKIILHKCNITTGIVYVIRDFQVCPET
jgi:hypothetical protein